MCESEQRQLSLFIDAGEERTGYVYALISHNRIAVKIGWTGRTPRRRGGELRADGQMLCWWPGDQFDEQRLHREMEAHRLAGNREWFALDPEVIRFLIAQCQQHDFPQALRLLRSLPLTTVQLPATAA